MELTKTTKAFDLDIIITVTRQDVEDTLVTAIESGISYWCMALDCPGIENMDEPTNIAVAKALFGGHEVRCQTEEGEWKVLTLAKLRSGFIQWYLLRGRQGHGPALEADGLDIGSIDATEADAIFQFAIFGEIVYG